MGDRNYQSISLANGAGDIMFFVSDCKYGGKICQYLNITVIVANTNLIDWS